MTSWILFNHFIIICSFSNNFSIYEIRNVRELTCNDFIQNTLLIKIYIGKKIKSKIHGCYKVSAQLNFLKFFIFIQWTFSPISYKVTLFSFCD